MDKYDIVSRYLLFRRVKEPLPRKVIYVDDKREITDYIENTITKLVDSGARLGLLLSGGMDSGILANYLPIKSIAYTFHYEEGAKYCEYEVAKQYIKKGIEHKLISFGKVDFFNALETLTLKKKEPIVPHDPAIWLACQLAKQDGITHLLTGTGADGRMGGFAHFRRNSNFEDFLKILYRQFVRPGKVLKKPKDLRSIIMRYTKNGEVDVSRFLLEIGTEGTSVSDTITLAGMHPIMIFGDLGDRSTLNPSGGGKQLLQSIFYDIYGWRYGKTKIPLPVPYDVWMKNYMPDHPDIKPDATKGMGSKNKMQVYASELYLRRIWDRDFSDIYI